MHSEINSDKPGTCPKCGMRLVASKAHHEMAHHSHSPNSKKLSGWEKFKQSMTMTMGMEHAGIAGREMSKMMEEDIKTKFLFALIMTIPIIAYSPISINILGLHLPTPIPVQWILLLLATPVYFYSGWIFLYSSVKALLARTLNMSVLIAVGITAAYGFSVLLTLLGNPDSFYDAAAMLITFVLFGHWMEMKSRRGTTDALQALFDLVPPQARILRGGKEELMPTSMVRVGDLIVLKPGDKAPVDGEIVEGETSIDESLITGESMPVPKKVGDGVIGGSINQSGSIKYRATKVGDETALAQIVKMVEIAQNSKAPGQRVADRFAQYLVVFAVGAGIITFVAWNYFAGAGFLVALTFAISTIVIACPDALGLATPTAVAVGTGLGARHNILIKDATTLEGLSKIQVVVLDKTGTLTEGKPRVVKIFAINHFSEGEILQITAAVEAKSNHPLSVAVLDEMKRRKLAIKSEVKSFENIQGLGVKAIVGSDMVIVGTRKLMEMSGIRLLELDSEINQLLENGNTVMIVAVNGRASGVIGAEDPIKSNSRRAVENLKKMGIESVIITGDNKATASIIAGKLGIIKFFAEVLPADKARYVKDLQEGGKFVAMVGDGVNDAPALAQADIGVAIGAGTDVAIETAKVVLTKSDPVDILRAIRLSKATVRKMKENLLWASIYNILAVPIAAGVLYPSYHLLLPPEISALLMSASSIIVATNAVLLNRAEKELLEI
ncbi:MAG: copper-translocating P-type ATPase [Candidatus Micrarchaeota archaeon]|nr:copper-translocating P-type ATPase [Candidatus Micrarchaeota archaeon]